MLSVGPIHWHLFRFLYNLWPFSPASSCDQEQQSAQEEARQHKNDAVFVPDCAQGGLYKPVQCHPSTGYCWCVLVDTGRPIPGTSTRWERLHLYENSNGLKLTYGDFPLIYKDSWNLSLSSFYGKQTRQLLHKAGKWSWSPLQHSGQLRDRLSNWMTLPHSLCWQICSALKCPRTILNIIFPLVWTSACLQPYKLDRIFCIYWKLSEINFQTTKKKPLYLRLHISVT